MKPLEGPSALPTAGPISLTGRVDDNSRRDETILEALGGPDVLDEIVKDFYRRVTGDPLLAPEFDGVDVDRVVHMQDEFLAAAFGGSGYATEIDLRAAHGGHRISSHQFSRYVEHFVDTLADRGLPHAAIERATERLALYVDDVVGQYGDAG